MAVTIPDAYRDLLERAVVVTLVTLMPDGQPQASPVWFKYDGAHILISTARKRQKARNMAADPRTAVLFVDPDNAYRYLEVRGVVDEITEDGALDLINELAKKYRNVNEFYSSAAQRERETRVTFKIRPTHVVAH